MQLSEKIDYEKELRNNMIIIPVVMNTSSTPIVAVDNSKKTKVRRPRKNKNVVENEEAVMDATLNEITEQIKQLVLEEKAVLNNQAPENLEKMMDVAKTSNIDTHRHEVLEHR